MQSPALTLHNTLIELHLHKVHNLIERAIWIRFSETNAHTHTHTLTHRREILFYMCLILCTVGAAVMQFPGGPVSGAICPRRLHGDARLVLTCDIRNARDSSRLVQERYLVTVNKQITDYVAIALRKT